MEKLEEKLKKSDYIKSKNTKTETEEKKLK